MTEKNPVKRTVLHPTALRQNGADFIRTYHHITVPTSVTVEDVLSPRFWSHHTGLLNHGDLIDILSEDDSLDMQVRVIGKGVGMVFVRPLRVWKREDADEGEPEQDIPDGYAVSFAPKQKWRVILKDPDEIIFKDLPSKGVAIAKAVEHARQADAA